jgi:hypothetical protein
MNVQPEINEIKQMTNTVDGLEGRPFDYKKEAARWVQFKSGKKKMKLRKYVRIMALNINKINGKGDEVNRKFIIDNYNTYGFEGVRKYMNEEIETVKKVVE